MSSSGFHEIHLFCTSRSVKLRRLIQALPNLRPNRQCDPANIPPGSVCFEYPAGKEHELETAANHIGLSFEWGIGGANWIAPFALGDRLYLINDVPELAIYDISDPSSPVSIGAVNLEGIPTALWLSESVAYVANSDGQIFRVNVDDPTAPTYDASETTETGLNISQIKVYQELMTVVSSTATALYDSSQIPAKELMTLEGTPTIVGSGIGLQGRRLLFADASGSPCVLRSYRLGGFRCFAIEAALLHSLEVAAERVVARHGLFKGDLFANSLTLQDELEVSGIVFVDVDDGSLQRLTIESGVLTVTAL